ncbi:MAG: hypothetical protein JKY47_16110 [Thalassospira sp.]|jgi:hypothetical protein|nr:hypothetical protein [Thalassospira sp.]
MALSVWVSDTDGPHIPDGLLGLYNAGLSMPDKNGNYGGRRNFSGHFRVLENGGALADGEA